MSVTGPSYTINAITHLSELELKRNVPDEASWHNAYKDSCYVFVGGLPYGLTEGDIAIVFSQWGELVDVHLVRDKKSGKSNGFAFIGYEDQRSTVLAVDNFNGYELLGRRLRVDHCRNFRAPKAPKKQGDGSGPAQQEGGSDSEAPEEYKPSGAEGKGYQVYNITESVQRITCASFSTSNAQKALPANVCGIPDADEEWAARFEASLFWENEDDVEIKSSTGNEAKEKHHHRHKRSHRHGHSEHKNRHREAAEDGNHGPDESGNESFEKNQIQDRLQSSTWDNSSKRPAKVRSERHRKSRSRSRPKDSHKACRERRSENVARSGSGDRLSRRDLSDGGRVKGYFEKDHKQRVDLPWGREEMTRSKENEGLFREEPRWSQDRFGGMNRVGKADHRAHGRRRS